MALPRRNLEWLRDKGNGNGEGERTGREGCAVDAMERRGAGGVEKAGRLCYCQVLGV